MREQVGAVQGTKGQPHSFYQELHELRPCESCLEGLAVAGAVWCGECKAALVALLCDGEMAQ